MGLQFLSAPTNYYGCSTTGKSMFCRTIYNTVFVHAKPLIFFCRSGNLPQAMEELNRMVRVGLYPEASDYSHLLRSCLKSQCLSAGRIVHATMIVTGFKPGLFIGSLLMDVYHKSARFADAHEVFDEMPQKKFHSWNTEMSAFLREGNLEKARQVFEEMPEHTETAWDSMIRAYLKHGESEEALQLFRLMRISGCAPSRTSCSCALNACGNLANLKLGKILHAQVVKNGFQLMGILGNALVDMYAKCGDVGFAQKTFDRLREKDQTAWNSILSGYSRCGLPEETIWAFRSMSKSGALPDQFTFAIVLSACARSWALEQGEQVHSNIIKRGFESNSFCEGSLIDMYAKCNLVGVARQLFDRIRNPDTISWTTMIAGYVQIGCSEEALALFLGMQQKGSKPDQVAFVTVITACASQGRLEDAHNLFAQMPNPNVVAWNAMISGYTQNGREVEALSFFQKMRLAGIKSTRSTLGSVLSAIANLADLVMGQQIHSEAIRLGLDSNVFVGSSLISMYAKCCVIEDARRVFDTSVQRNIVLWNAMLGGYVQNGYPDQVMELFTGLQDFRLLPDAFTYASILSACACLETIDVGLKLHSTLIKSNLESSLYVGNALVDMYAKCGYLEDAIQQFELIPNRDIVSWNAIIVGHAHNEDETKALDFFRCMNLDHVQPDEVSFASILSACANLQSLEQGKQVHCFSIKSGFELSVYSGSALVDMYAKCGAMEAANKVMANMPIQSVVSRNSLIAGYIQNNNSEKAINLFHQMQAEGLMPTHITFASILGSCSGPSGLDIGKQVHCRAVKAGVITDVLLGTSLLGMYMKCQSINNAYKLFVEMPNENTVSWTAIISGHAQNSLSEEALSLFRKMRISNYGGRPDQATFASVLRACASLSALRDGKEVHSLIIKTGFGSDEYTGSALVDMYSKCGEVDDSLRAFEEMVDKRDVIPWNSMIVGFAKNGYADNALKLFEQMQQVHVKPDDITFLGVLMACSHAGLVSQGCGFFNSMIERYGIVPRADHFGCMIDLLGRGGYLHEAEELINKLAFEPDAVIWSTLLAACRLHGDTLRGKWAAEKLIELEPQNSSPYVLLSNIYAASGNWDGVNSVRKLMHERGVKKLPGCSWIVAGKKTNSFVAGDKFHPLAGEIYAALENLTAQMKEDGYVARSDPLLHDED